MKLTRDHMSLVVEALGLLTALSFGFSAVANSLIFWMAWGINYFLVASPADVVMSSFLVVAVLLVLAAVAASVTALVMLPAYYLGKRSARYRWSKFSNALALFVALVTVMSFAALLGTVVTAYRQSQRLLAAQYESTKEVSDLITSMLTTEQQKQAAVLFDRSRLVYRMMDIDRFNKRKDFSYPTGLRVSYTTDVEEACRLAPILWIGSGSAVVGCKNGVRVFHKLERITSEPIG